MDRRALFWWCLTVSYWLAVVSEPHDPFPETQDTTCCTTCKAANSKTLCTTFNTGYAIKKIQWFIILENPSRYAQITINDMTYPANHDGYTAPCRECPPGWYRKSDTCLCSKCSDACPSNQYESVSCRPTTNRVCSACGTCGVGQQLSANCNGVSNIVCETCPAGKYRDQTVVNTQTACATCRACSVTSREARSGCSNSVNEPCPQCGVGNIVVVGGSTDSCQLCTTGKYARASDNTCVPCKDCLRTERELSVCQASADRTCEPCGNDKYTLALNAVTCAGCTETHYVGGGGSCPVCAGSSCGFGNYRTCTFTEAAGGVKTCKACQGQSETQNCNAGYGVTVRCDGQGTEMVSCAVCGAGKHRPAGTDLVGDFQTCKPCDLGYYKSAAGSGSCSACTNKPASNAQYITWGALLPSSNTCPW